MRRNLSVLVACGAAAAVGGCSTPAAPTFSVVDVGVTSRTDEGVVVTFVLEGKNTNPDPLKLDDVSYSLSLGGKQVFSGTRNAQATLPANGSQRVQLPVAMTNEVSAEATRDGAAQQYRLNGTMIYKIPGSIAEIFFDSGVRQPTVGFGESGTLDFSKSGIAGTPGVGAAGGE